MQPDLVLVVDFGAQYAQLIARRVREAHVYSEIVPHTTPVAEMMPRSPGRSSCPAARPASTRRRAAVDAALVRRRVPVFGICYGFQAMAQALGGEVADTGGSEFGGTHARVIDPGGCCAALPASQQVWMSHGDSVTRAPGFTVTATTAGAPVAAFEDLARRLAGVQFHPEVLHTEHGQQVLEHFLYEIAGVRPDWTRPTSSTSRSSRIRAQVGGERVICGLSGGVDSAVAAALVQRAVGDQLTCVFVDHGLLRAGEAEQVERDFVAATGVRLQVVDAAERFLTRSPG